MITKCPYCKKGTIEYYSEIHLIPGTTHPKQEAGFEGNCNNCNASIYTKFKEYEVEAISYDNNMNELDRKIIKV